MLGAPIDSTLLLAAYAQGIFPMADTAKDSTVHWIEPQCRAIIPLKEFHLARRLQRTLRADHFVVTHDQAFAAMVALCAEVALDRPETWINAAIQNSYNELHHRGFAHSIECWQDGQLVGGLYGVALGRAFFGESMVSHTRDASKIALAFLVARLCAGGWKLLDCQFMTPHLATLGAIEISQLDYRARLQAALDPTQSAGDWHRLECHATNHPPDESSPAPLSGKVIAQLLTKTS